MITGSHHLITFINQIQKVYQKWQEGYLPSHCLLCQLPSQAKLICHFCHEAILTERHYCLHCGCGLSHSQAFCGECLQHTFNFTQLHAIASYQAPFPALIKQLKYNHKLLYADLLGLLLADSIKQRYKHHELADIDYLIPVPLHLKKHRARGFNQTQVISDALIKYLPLTIMNHALIRNKPTNAQEGLSRTQRAHNLKSAFALTSSAHSILNGKHVVLIDDVVTTGATINSCCDALFAANVKKIDVWCICRTELL